MLLTVRQCDADGGKLCCHQFWQLSVQYETPTVRFLKGQKSAHTLQTLGTRSCYAKGCSNHQRQGFRRQLADEHRWLLALQSRSLIHHRAAMLPVILLQIALRKSFLEQRMNLMPFGISDRL
jgi:hypothetical protein